MLRRFVIAALPLAASACGANVGQRYESDVRFERCWSLDWQADVRAELRRHCWEEWLTHFARGQTRDRIEHAKLQIADIDGRAEGAKAAGQALPEPTSAFQPVPMMASAPPVAASSASASASAPPPPPARTDCQKKCDQNLEGCLKFCKSPVCEAACAKKHGTCDAQCPAPSAKP